MIFGISWLVPIIAIASSIVFLIVVESPVWPDSFKAEFTEMLDIKGILANWAPAEWHDVIGTAEGRVKALREQLEVVT